VLLLVWWWRLRLGVRSGASRLVILVVNRLVFRLRAGRGQAVPPAVSYFDQQQRGEVLSRPPTTPTTSPDAAADHEQMVTSLLTIVGVMVMMFWISPLLAVIA